MTDEWDDATVNDNDKNKAAAGDVAAGAGFDGADLLFDDANGFDTTGLDLDGAGPSGLESMANAGSDAAKDAETAESTEEDAADDGVDVSESASAMDEFSGALDAAGESDADGADDAASRRCPFVKGLLILAAVGLVVLLIGLVARNVWKILLLSGGCLVLVCGLIGAICVAILGRVKEK